MTDPDSGTGTLVLGLGNPLMGDDGVGLVALNALCDRVFEPRVTLIDGGTWGMNLLPLIEAAQRVLFLDAINVGAEPGELIVLERSQIPRGLGTKLSPHQIDLREVLAVCELRGSFPEHVAALGLQPDLVDMSLQLSPAVRAGLPRLVEAATVRLAAWGHLQVPATAATTHA